MKKSNSNILKFAPFFSLYGAKQQSKTVVTNKLGVNSRLPLQFIKTVNYTQLSNIYSNALVGKKLQMQIKDNISFLKNLRTFKGLRHKASLPVRGQRTHTNAKTCKKKSRKKA